MPCWGPLETKGDAKLVCEVIPQLFCGLICENFFSVIVIYTLLYLSLHYSFYFVHQSLPSLISSNFEALAQPNLLDEQILDWGSIIVCNVLCFTILMFLSRLVEWDWTRIRITIHKSNEHLSTFKHSAFPMNCEIQTYIKYLIKQSMIL